MYIVVYGKKNNNNNNNAVVFIRKHMFNLRFNILFYKTVYIVYIYILLWMFLINNSVFLSTLWVIKFYVYNIYFFFI